MMTAHLECYQGYLRSFEAIPVPSLMRLAEGVASHTHSALGMACSAIIILLFWMFYVLL